MLAIDLIGSFFAQVVQNNGNAGGASIALGVPLCFGLFGLAALVLFIWALVDAIKNPNLDSNARLIWILVIIFTSPIGPILYFLIGRKK